MKRPIGIGIIGCGRVMQGPYMTLAEKLYCRGELEIVVAADKKPDLEPMVTKELGLPEFTSDYRRVIEHPNVEAVLILTSMNEHGALARAALQAGKHVLVEKPMAVTLEEAQVLMEEADKSDRLLVCAPHVIHSPTYRLIWDHLRNGDIGSVNLARARYGWSGPDWGPWFYKPGGGALFDLGIYNVTSLAGFLGPVRRVTALVGTAIKEREVDGEMINVEADDNAHLLLDFGDSCFAVVSTGFTMQKYRSPSIELYGTKGTIQMLGDDWNPQGYEMYENATGAWKLFDEPDPFWPWTDGLRHMIDCIRTGAKPLNTPEHAYHALEVMLKAKESAREGRAVEINSEFPALGFLSTEGAFEEAHRVHDRSYAR